MNSEIHPTNAQSANLNRINDSSVESRTTARAPGRRGQVLPGVKVSNGGEAGTGAGLRVGTSAAHTGGTAGNPSNFELETHRTPPLCARSDFGVGTRGIDAQHRLKSYFEVTQSHKD